MNKAQIIVAICHLILVGICMIMWCRSVRFEERWKKNVGYIFVVLLFASMYFTAGIGITKDENKKISISVEQLREFRKHYESK